MCAEAAHGLEALTPPTLQGQQTTQAPITLTSVLRNRKMMFYGTYCSGLSVRLRKQHPLRMQSAPGLRTATCRMTRR